ncbi:DUF4129 domain-containing protein [Streptomyces sp. NPDC006662]|uniref:DUF4129 domain-containing protein n=1 Tax=Streptomyces sp. NPDC006662 TaxID=3156902 RepID=UPI003405524A
MGRQRTAGGPRRRGTTGAARAATGALAVGAAALGALLLRPEGSLLDQGRGPLGGSFVLVTGLALLALLGGLALYGKYGEQLGGERTLDPVEQRLADGVRRVLLAAPPALPLLMVVLHRFGPSGTTPGGGSGAPAPLPSAPEHPVPVPAPGAGTPAPQDPGAHLGPADLLPALGIALLALALVLAGTRLWRHLTRPPAPEGHPAYTRSEDESGLLARAVDVGQRALLDRTDARTAVIACYLAMEESLAGSGVARRASDSPQDLLERALAGGLPAGEAAAELTALFREARYSTHPMHEGHRDRAAAALAGIARALSPLTGGAGAGAV